MTLSLTIDREEAIKLHKLLDDVADLLENGHGHRFAGRRILGRSEYEHDLITVSRCFAYDLKDAINAAHPRRRRAG